MQLKMIPLVSFAGPAWCALIVVVGALRVMVFAQAQETLRQALAMGADRAIHINSEMRTDQVRRLRGLASAGQVASPPTTA